MTPFLPRWPEDSPIREAAWIARCVGDPETTPLTERNLITLGYGRIDIADAAGLEALARGRR